MGSTQYVHSPIACAQPGGLELWCQRFEPGALPVLESTAEQIEALAKAEDGVDAHLLADVIGGDPLMCLKVMSHVAALRAGREGGEPETLTGALVMLGIPPFFRAFGAQTTVEERLRDQPEALSGFRRVLLRSLRAARFAMGFAVHRMDHDAAVIHQAALLHDFVELLIWVEAPELALEVASRQARDSSLRSARAQEAVLGVDLCRLQHRLMLQWRLPALLVSITDDHSPHTTPQAASVRLAIRIARHSAVGWDNAALPDDYAEVASLLQLSPPHVQRLLLEIDAD